MTHLDEDLPPSPAATLRCPECGELITVPIAIVLETGPGGQVIRCDPDLTDLWAHAWTHGIRPHTEGTDAG